MGKEPAPEPGQIRLGSARSEILYPLIPQESPVSSFAWQTIQ